MQTTRLGRSGLQVSRLALGMMTWGTTAWRPWIRSEEEGRPVFRRAVELGVDFFDTADMYSAGMSEEITGRFVREFCRRDEVVVATKLFYPVDLAFKGGNAPGPKPAQAPNSAGLSRKRILAAIDASLTRLKLDHVDLYQIHRFDPQVPVEETMEALHDVVRAGKARYLGASSMYAWQFAKLQSAAKRHGWTPFISMQNHYNLAYREEEREMNPYCLDTGVGLIPWSPLARGFLAGNRSREDAAAGATSRAATDDIAQKLYYRDEDFAVVEALKAVAAGRGASPATVAYAWLLSRPGVAAPIVGVSSVAQLEQASAALEIALTAEEVAALEAPYRPHSIAGHT
ncbi:MAG: aldo/keto reductase [Betaproteobacteria bacterium]